MDFTLIFAAVAIVLMSLVIIGSATHINAASEGGYGFVQRRYTGSMRLRPGSAHFTGLAYFFAVIPNAHRQAVVSPLKTATPMV